MSARHLALASFSLLLASLAACDDGGGGGDGGDGGGSGQGGGTGGGDASAVTSGTPLPAGVTSGGPLPTALEVCSGACACDAECLAEEGTNVRGCMTRLDEDAASAALAGCTPTYEAYLSCLGDRWTCGAPDVCDALADTLWTCVDALCVDGGALCGWEGQFDCRYPEQRCQATCVVESGSCDWSTCWDACYM